MLTKGNHKQHTYSNPFKSACIFIFVHDVLGPEVCVAKYQEGYLSVVTYTSDQSDGSETNAPLSRKPTLFLSDIRAILTVSLLFHVSIYTYL